jgi:hypothetical protein
MLRSGDANLSLEHFDRTTLSAQQLAVINQEVLDGEGRYTDGLQAPDDVLTQSILNGVALIRTNSSRDSVARKRSRRNPRSAQQVGNRAPARDQVGE